MVMFVFLSITLVTIALVLLLPGIWRTPKRDISDRTSQNINIVKEQLLALDESLRRGELTPEQFQLSKDELEASLLQDTQPGESVMDSKSTWPHGRRLTIVLSLILPLFIAGGYLLIGTPAALNTQHQAQPVSPHTTDNQNLPSVEEMLARLEKKLEQQPNNIDGWLMAGRSYMSLKRYDDAVRALKRAYELNAENPSIIFRYADALAMLHNGRLSGEPFKLLQKGLTLEPENVMGLWLAGNAYAEQQQYSDAITYWHRARQQLSSEPAAVQELDVLIATAEQKMTGRTTSVPVKETATATAGINVTVSLSPELATRATPGETVFILAKAMNGPPMPLAVVRRKVSDLPLTIQLSEDMAMAAGMSLANFNDVVLVARVSKSGQATAAHGDLIGQREVRDWRHARPQTVVIESVLGQR